MMVGSLFSTCKLIRIVQPTGTPASVETPNIQWRSNAALVEGEFPPRQIVGWQEMGDYPDWGEAVLLQGIQFSDDEFKIILNSANINEDEIEDLSYVSTLADIDEQRSEQRWVINNFMDNTRMRPLEGDKLAGYPYWVQDVEYPNCPICNRMMDRYIFEFASDDNIPYLWGDVGSG